MKKFLTAACFIAMTAPIHALATAVPGYSANPVKPTLVDLGEFKAGSYLLTGSGLVDLALGLDILFKPDGTPVRPGNIPNGTYVGDYGVYGPSGLNGKIGALIGTLSANPTTQDDWFQIGYAKNLTLSTSQHIYAAVNDTYYINNGRGFDVTVTSAVPEPASYALMFAGLGLLGWVSRRKRTKQ